MSKLKYISIFLVAVLLFYSCTKKFDKINTDPNNPSSVPPSNLLAFSIQDFGAHLWDSWGDIDEPESYSGHIGKIQYIDESRYQFRPGTVENMWTYCYRELKSLQVAINQAKDQNNTNLQGAAMVMQAYIWQIATDRWRDIPYTEALAADSGKIAPAYTTQETIYPALLSQLKDANTLLAQNNGSIGDGDLLFGNDATKWQKFCNSLRLRMAIRISNVAPTVAKATIEEITGNATANPIITDNTDNAYLMWPGAGTGTILTSEPWYTALFLGSRADNYAVGAPLINILLQYNDNRITVFATHPPNDATNSIYRGTPIGPTGSVAPGGINNYSRIGERFSGDPTGFTPFLGAAEVQFILAEAAAKGWNAGTTAAVAYNKGIDLSFAENGVDVGNYKTTANVVWNGDIKRIYLQKWIALYKNGHEAWAESRRTDVPLLPPAAGSPYTGHNRPPFRYPYPDSETRLNEKIALLM